MRYQKVQHPAILIPCDLTPITFAAIIAPFYFKEMININTCTDIYILIISQINAIVNTFLTQNLNLFARHSMMYDVGSLQSGFCRSFCEPTSFCYSLLCLEDLQIAIYSFFLPRRTARTAAATITAATMPMIIIIVIIVAEFLSALSVPPLSVVVGVVLFVVFGV